MSTKENYIKQAEKQMEKYRDKISKIDDLLKNKKESGESELLAHRENLKDKFDQAEKMLKKIKSGSEENYEKIKENATEIFESLKEAFHEFSSFLSMEQLSRTKDVVIDYGNEKLDEFQSFVKERPLTIAAWAMGIGFIIGTLFTRSK
ncbi:MAG: hypothetical protein BGO67_09250 [Alphaproteobacteria bacterium 41-28]|nr:MAG: hypothetical protein BGO67_09250 [Alphaproteobacteria bacterium 41-28]